MLFEKALPLCHSEHVLSTLSLVQVRLLEVGHLGIQGQLTLQKEPQACGGAGRAWACFSEVSFTLTVNG
jgi:hypothetical protein